MTNINWNIYAVFQLIFKFFVDIMIIGKMLKSLKNIEKKNFKIYKLSCLEQQKETNFKKL